MTKTRLLSYLPIAFLAGFVLFSTDAWAIQCGTEPNCKTQCWECEITVGGGFAGNSATTTRRTKCAAENPCTQGGVLIGTDTNFVSSTNNAINSSVSTANDDGTITTKKKDAFGNIEETISQNEYTHKPNVNIVGNSAVAKFVNENLAIAGKQGKITALKDTLKKKYDE